MRVAWGSATGVSRLCGRRRGPWADLWQPAARRPDPFSPRAPSCSDGVDVSFSTAGGVEIEENWDKVKTVALATGQGATSERRRRRGRAGGGQGGRRVGPRRAVRRPGRLFPSNVWCVVPAPARRRLPPARPCPAGEALAPLVAPLPLELRPKMEAFIRNCFTVSANDTPPLAAPGPPLAPLPPPGRRCHLWPAGACPPFSLPSKSWQPLTATPRSCHPSPPPHVAPCRPPSPAGTPPSPAVTPRCLTTSTPACWR